MNEFFKLVFFFSIIQLAYSNFGKLINFFFYFLTRYKKIDQYNLFVDLNVVHLEQLSRNFEKVFKAREHDSILTIVVNQQGYFAHKNLLSTTSSYLR